MYNHLLGMNGFILVHVMEVVLIVIEWDMRYWIVHLIVVNFHLNNLSNLFKRIDTKALWKKCDQRAFSRSFLYVFQPHSYHKKVTRPKLYYQLVVFSFKV
jgi:hypothetical protein